VEIKHAENGILPNAINDLYFRMNRKHFSCKRTAFSAKPS
jgi:hypothetical protein